MDLANVYLQQASAIDPDHEEVKQLKIAIESVQGSGTGTGLDSLSPSSSSSDLERATGFYNTGLSHFNQKQFALAASAFQESCTLGGNNPIFRSACTNADAQRHAVEECACDLRWRGQRWITGAGKQCHCRRVSANVCWRGMNVTGARICPGNIRPHPTPYGFRRSCCNRPKCRR